MVRWRTALPAAPAGDGLPFLIEHELAGAEWSAEARRARAEFAHPFGGRAALIRLELAVDDPDEWAGRYEAALRIPSRRHPGGAVDMPIGGHVLRLVPALAGGPDATIVLEVSAGRSRSLNLLGCRFEIELESIA